MSIILPAIYHHAELFMFLSVLYNKYYRYWIANQQVLNADPMSAHYNKNTWKPQSCSPTPPDAWHVWNSRSSLFASCVRQAMSVDLSLGVHNVQHNRHKNKQFRRHNDNEKHSVYGILRMKVHRLLFSRNFLILHWIWSIRHEWKLELWMSSILAVHYLTSKQLVVFRCVDVSVFRLRHFLTIATSKKW